MKREVRCAGNKVHPMIIVTTYRRLWDWRIWFGYEPMTTTKAYHQLKDGTVEDFEGKSPPEDVLQDILDKLGG